MNGLPCPTCGSELSYLEEYHRHYCYACGRYAPEGYGDRGPKTCPTCGGFLSYIVAYERYYCYRCNTYPTEGALAETKRTAPLTSPDVPSTAEPLVTTADNVSEPTEPEGQSVEPMETPNEPGQPVEESADEGLPEESWSPGEKPPLIRDVIVQAKKPTLLDLCKAYDLDLAGTKEELRERLLSYLDEREAESQTEQPEPAVEEQPLEPRPEESADEDMATIEPAEPAPEPTAPDERAEEIPDEQADIGTQSSPEPIVPAATPIQQITEEPRAEAAITPSESVGASPAPRTVQEVAKIDNPCPNCGRELTYIPQYNRWYCYACRAYAPVAKPKNACPNCGAALRWIHQYARFWCDSCRRYAPADLPRPEGAVVPRATIAVERPVQARIFQQAVGVFHRHRSPGSGLGVMGLGLALFVLYEALVDLPAALTFRTGIIVSPDVAWGLRFFAFVLVAGGAMMGLTAVRDRR